jgi:hypothetical protein
MSLEDCVYIATELDVKDTLRRFVKLSDEDIELKQSESNDGTELLSGIKPNQYTLHALDFEPEDQSIIAEWLGIIPTVQLIFRLNKWRNTNKIQDDILRTTLKVIDNSSWDIALLEGCDDPVLLRKSGHLILQRDHGFWTSDRLKIITTSYSVEELKLYGA